MTTQLVQILYLIATGLFIFALHWMNDPKTARHGVYAGVAAMALGILGTLGLLGRFPAVNWEWMAVAAVIGVIVGGFMITDRMLKMFRRETRNRD